MALIHINIGSNQGDRAANIERAVALIANRLDPHSRAEIKLAPIVESEPWGFDSENRFLNLGLMVVTKNDDIPDPESILRQLQAIEEEISSKPHRHADGSYKDREIDIDLIAVDDIVIDSPVLTLPHPRMSDRLFVLEPMLILDPQWRHPVSGLCLKELSDNVK